MASLALSSLTRAGLATRAAALVEPVLAGARVDARTLTKLDDATVATLAVFNKTVGEAVAELPAPSPSHVAGSQSLAACLDLAEAVARAEATAGHAPDVCLTPGQPADETLTHLTQNSLQRRFVKLLTIYGEASRIAGDDQGSLPDTRSATPRASASAAQLPVMPHQFSGLMNETTGRSTSCQAGIGRTLASLDALSKLTCDIEQAGLRLKALGWHRAPAIVEAFQRTRETLANRQDRLQMEYQNSRCEQDARKGAMANLCSALNVSMFDHLRQ